MPATNGMQLAQREPAVLETWLVDFDKTWEETALAAWAAGRLPGPDDPLRSMALAELVKIDMERQWQRGQRLTVESYLERYPELGTRETVRPDLLLAEFRIRTQFGAPAELADFARRFPVPSAAFQELVAEAATMFTPADQDTSLAGRRTETVEPAPCRPEVPRAAPRLPGQELPPTFGRYRIQKKLGQGGMGAVYLAHDTQLDRPVALKVPQFRDEEGREIIERFLREARAAAKIQHPNLCPIYDVGEIGGIHYLTMAYIKGHLLSAAIRPGKPAPEPWIARMVRTLALALQEAHAQGVVHRDLKPANIMIDERDEPIIMDFGLARRTGTQEATLTQAGAVLGTPAYMAPEQARGRGDAVGPRSDIYSLGVILYELLTGRPPFQGEVMHVLCQVLADEPERPSTLRPGLDPQLEAVCRKAMAKAPEERYASMADFAAALAEFLNIRPALPPDRSPTAERPPKAAEMLTRLGKRPKIGRAAALGFVFMLVLLGIVVKLRTPHGTLVVEVDEPGVTIEVLDEQGTMQLQRQGERGAVTIAIDPGKHRLRLEKDGVAFFSKDFTMAAGGREVIRAKWEPPSHSLGPATGPPARGPAAKIAADASAWPVVFQETLTNPASARQLDYCVGQYQGRADLIDPQRGLCLPGCHTGNALWVQEPVSDCYQFSLDLRLSEGTIQCRLWGSGPGHGISENVGYCVKLDVRTGKGALLREGDCVCGFEATHGPDPEQFHALRLTRLGSRLLFTFDEQLLIDYVDPEPLSGPLHSRVGFGSCYNMGMLTYRNLVIRRPALSEQERTGLAAVPLHPPATIRPAANKEVLFEAGAGELAGERWLHTEPDNSAFCRDGKRVLSGPNGLPAVVWKTPIRGDFALEVTFEYVPPAVAYSARRPDEPWTEYWLRQGTEALNLHLLVVYADQLPAPDKFSAIVRPDDWPVGCQVGLPAGDGRYTIDWIKGRQLKLLAHSAHYTPVAGRKYTARLERRGEDVRLFIDGVLLLSAKQPLPTSDTSLPAFVGLQQFLGLSLIHRMAAYRIEAESGGDDPHVTGP